MRLSWSLSALALTASTVSAFAPVQNQAVVARSCSALNAVATADVKAKQDATMEKMKAKDATSAAISADVSCDLCIDIGNWAESKKWPSRKVRPFQGTAPCVNEPIKSTISFASGQWLYESAQFKGKNSTKSGLN